MQRDVVANGTRSRNGSGGWPRSVWNRFALNISLKDLYKLEDAVQSEYQEQSLKGAAELSVRKEQG